jgi:hypothetical protein
MVRELVQATQTIEIVIKDDQKVEERREIRKNG